MMPLDVAIDFVARLKWLEDGIRSMSEKEREVVNRAVHAFLQEFHKEFGEKIPTIAYYTAVGTLIYVALRRMPSVERAEHAANFSLVLYRSYEIAEREAEKEEMERSGGVM